MSDDDTKASPLRLSDQQIKYRMRVSDGYDLVVGPRTHYGCGHPVANGAPRCFCMWPRDTTRVIRVTND